MKPDITIDISPMLDPFLRVREELLYAIRAWEQLKTVSIWGAGKNGQAVRGLLLDAGLPIKCFYDAAMNGKMISDIPVKPEPTSLDDGELVLVSINDHHVFSKIPSFNGSKNRIMHVCDLSEPNARSRNMPLSEYVDRHKGERCFVVGNGPSLNKIDMSLLNNEVTFGSNRCFIGFDRWGVQFSYWAVEDQQVGGWQASEWKKQRGYMKFVPEDMLYHTEMDDEFVCPINLNRNIDFKDTPPIFSRYPHMLFTGRTVTYVLLQLAAIMGCSPIYLIGVDFSFSREGVQVEPGGEKWHQIKGDCNHFDSSYIPPGRFLNKPYWDRQELAFKSAKNAADLHKFEIYNATPESRLDVFEFVDYRSLF